MRYRVLYILIAIATVAAVVWVNTPLAWGFAALVFVTSAIDLLSLAFAGGVKLDFAVKASTVVGSPMSLNVNVHRPYLLTAAAIELVIETTNRMTGKTRLLTMFLAPDGNRECSYTCPVDSSSCGMQDYRLVSATVSDAFGLARVGVSGKFRGSFTVYPRMLDMSTRLTRSPRMDLTGISYDQRRRGQDRSEVFDIRDYQPSDPLHSIHWKLSSKLDRLVIREASRPSNNDLLILLDRRLKLTDGQELDDATIMALLELLCSLSIDLRRQGIGHSVAFAENDAMCEEEVESEESYQNMLDHILGTPMVDAERVPASVIEEYFNTHEFSKVVFVTPELNTDDVALMSRWHNLVVVHLSDNDEGPSIERNEGDYSLLSIPKTMLDERVKSLEI